MSETVWLLVGLICGAGIGIGSAVAVMVVMARKAIREGRSQAQMILAEARLQAESIRKEADLQAKEETLHRREGLEREIEESRKAQRDFERRLEKRDDLLDQKLEMINKKEREFESVQRFLADRQEELDRRGQDLKQVLAEQRDALHHISGMGAVEARGVLLQRVEEELQHEIGSRVLRHEQAVKEACGQKAREILATCTQRYAAGHTADTTTSTVDIPSDDMKGRIIGREGRNIRAFEKATGVDVIVDDTPGIVIVSGFDNVRREVAKISLNKLILDGRIHPTRIEEIVQETREEIEDHILQAGRAACEEVSIPALHPKLLEYLGRLKFRTSYSQNVLRHSIEVAFLTGMLAEELGLENALGRRCGLLHDIGKAVDHEMEGGHPQLGAELLKRFGEREEVVHAAFGHHDDLRVDRPYTVLVAAADAISASRPGARRETLEKYVRRLEELEGLVLGFPGVDQAYAIQAGREVRVIVDSDYVDDPGAAKLCRDVARAIQDQLNYPGEVKVTVLRETRNVEFAR